MTRTRPGITCSVFDRNRHVVRHYQRAAARSEGSCRVVGQLNSEPNESRSRESCPWRPAVTVTNAEPRNYQRTIRDSSNLDRREAVFEYWTQA
jgi:hypothetical protein